MGVREDDYHIEEGTGCAGRDGQEGGGEIAAARQAQQARPARPPVSPQKITRGIRRHERGPYRRTYNDSDGDGDDPDADMAAKRAKTASATKAKQARLPIALQIETGDDEGIRLLSKLEVLDRVGANYSNIWRWMREGRFPRSRALGGKTVWIKSEIDAWLAALPLRPLKGDKAA